LGGEKGGGGGGGAKKRAWHEWGEGLRDTAHAMMRTSVHTFSAANAGGSFIEKFLYTRSNVFGKREENLCVCVYVCQEWVSYG